MRNLVFLLLLLAGLHSCTKPQTIQPAYISAAFKSYFDYQPGTYWIFYDSLNNYFDSVAVASYTDQQVTTAQTSTEEVQIAMQGYYQGAVGSTSSWSMFLAENTCSISLDNNSGYYEPTGDELVNSMPFRTGSYSFSNNVTREPVTWNTVLLPNYTLGTATFNNVYMITNAFANGYNMDTFLINAANGFIAILRHNSYSSNERLFLTAEHIVH